jgi:hypothetical protein
MCPPDSREQRPDPLVWIPCWRVPANAARRFVDRLLSTRYAYAKEAIPRSLMSADSAWVRDPLSHARSGSDLSSTAEVLSTVGQHSRQPRSLLWTPCRMSPWRWLRPHLRGSHAPWPYPSVPIRVPAVPTRTSVVLRVHRAQVSMSCSCLLLSTPVLCSLALFVKINRKINQLMRYF